jgi:hypothetical protein
MWIFGDKERGICGKKIIEENFVEFFNIIFLTVKFATEQIF